tara:strand:+ start:545 stop:1327 length:783 start_codon:yes stop_codon:yes gene_type:complete
VSEELTYQKIWDTLSGVDCNEHTDKKGNLTYLSWAWAWGILMEHYPSANFEFADNETHADGSMTVHCTVKIGECQRSMWLPVMDYKNSAIKSANARDISDNKMRCLTKALALFGLGHYIYGGEDLPSSNKQPAKPKEEPAPAPVAIPKKSSALETRMAEQKSLVANATADNIEEVMNFIFHTIINFALPPEKSTPKHGDPETVAGWIDLFTSSNGNKKTLVELYNAGFKGEIKALNTRLDKIRALEIEQLRKLLQPKKEK